MFKHGLSRAEEQLAISQRKASRIQEEKEIAQKERAAQTARLRALRLDKESADKKA